MAGDAVGILAAMGDAIELRVARVGDVDALANIKITGWVTTYADLVPAGVLGPLVDDVRTRADFAVLVTDPNAVLLVATDDDVVVGFGVGDATTGYIDSLHVLPAHRSGGTGRQLLGALASELSARGCTEIALHVVSGNAGAQRFYERLGGELIGTAPADWAPDVIEAHYRWPDPQRLAEAATR
ncbi:MAG: acetyltransferase, family [Ilumatobacteraceae bacterium]|nr:acetyltransferase, family [Ilumatobacteraceae bacterium]MCU1390955.1 acetyltransferase, family [Ilumatobacteraceae bacterium]